MTDIIATLLDEQETFEMELAKFATHMLLEAQKENVKLEEKVKVFEAIQPYHAARGKYKDKSAPNGKGNGATNFSKFKANVKETPQEQ